MKYVYVLESIGNPDRHYIGSTTDLKRRVAEHNKGESGHTKKFAPWNLICYFAFSDTEKADKFETYLKSGSGREFAKRHF
jgi:putative endonuclease